MGTPAQLSQHPDPPLSHPSQRPPGSAMASLAPPAAPQLPSQRSGPARWTDEMDQEEILLSPAGSPHGPALPCGTHFCLQTVNKQIRCFLQIIISLSHISWGQESGFTQLPVPQKTLSPSPGHGALSIPGATAGFAGSPGNREALSNSRQPLHPRAIVRSPSSHVQMAGDSPRHDASEGRQATGSQALVRCGAGGHLSN